MTDSERTALSVDRDLLGTVLRELAHRGAGRRESGCFLLGFPTSERSDSATGLRRVEDVAYYDDLDPSCLTGGITFGAAGYSALAEVCRRGGLEVVGDIHTHPGPHVQQSRIDATHPMVAIAGHVAVIAPNYAVGAPSTAALGVHRLRPDGTWDSHYGADVEKVFKTTNPRMALRKRCLQVLRLAWRAIHRRTRNFEDQGAGRDA